MNKEKFIRTTVPMDELLAGLAEEAAELAQAALKYRRSFTFANPTPTTPEDARAALLEEIADVELYLSILGFYKDKSDINALADHTRSKLARWVARLQEVPT
jgi:NTP pyrophosphatase (non-canonical NTP hydrolase)